MGTPLLPTVTAIALTAVTVAGCSTEPPVTLSTNVDWVEARWPELGDVESATSANRSTGEWLPSPDDFVDAIAVLTPQAAEDLRGDYDDFLPADLPGGLPEWVLQELPSGASWQVSEDLNEALLAQSEVGGQVTAWVAVGSDVVFLQHVEV